MLTWNCSEYTENNRFFVYSKFSECTELFKMWRPHFFQRAACLRCFPFAAFSSLRRKRLVHGIPPQLGLTVLLTMLVSLHGSQLSSPLHFTLVSLQRRCLLALLSSKIWAFSFSWCRSGRSRRYVQFFSFVSFIALFRTLHSAPRSQVWGSSTRGYSSGKLLWS